jgi:hypothetical protein
VPAGLLVGRILAVNEDKRFVLFETTGPRRDYDTGFPMEARGPGGGEAVPLRVSPERHLRFATADYSGDLPPAAGDLVFTAGPVEGASPDAADGGGEEASGPLDPAVLDPVAPLDPIDPQKVLDELVDALPPVLE